MHLRARRGLLVLTLAGLAGIAACEDPFTPQAAGPNIDQSFELWALTGTPVSYPSAVVVASSFGPFALRLDASGSFDLAFDIDTTGRLVVYPVSSIVAPVSGTREVQFLRGVGPYNTIVEAPRTGWTSDTVLVVNEGQTFLVKVTTLVCQYDIRQQVYAKFAVDSILVADRRIKLSARINPNCGFRSLLSGVPEF